MNILIVIPELSYRGGERIFYTLAKGLGQEGHKVKILAARVKADAFKFEPPISLLTLPGILQKLMGNNLIFYIILFPVLFDSLSINSGDVDVIDSESGFALWASVLVGKLRHKKVVWTIFAFESDILPKGLANRLFRYIYGRVDRFIARKADGYKCIAPRISRSLKKAYGIDDVDVIIPAIDPDRFNNAKPFEVIRKFGLKGKLVVLLPATLHLKKNQRLAIDSLGKILEVFPNVVLVLLGSGPDREDLVSYAEARGLGGSVIFAGVAYGDGIKNYYAASDVVLVCSKVENEGLSMTALEALANGVMPIVSVGAGVAEILSKKNIALVVNPDVSEFSQAIINYLRTPLKYENMIVRGKRWVSEELTLKNFTNKTLDVYESLFLHI